MDVLFDTNPYRYLAAGKTPEQVTVIMSKIRVAEKAEGIKAWSAPTVWLELFYHLGDPAGRNFADCLAAVVACYLHTPADDGRKYQLAPRATTLQAHTLFGYMDPIEDDVLRGLNYIAGELCNKPSRDTVQQFAAELGSIKQFVQTQENTFMERFENVKSHLSEDDSLQRLYLALAQLIAASIGINPAGWSPAEKEILTKKVEHFFPAPFQLYLEIRKRTIENPKLDISTGSKRNWFWDNNMLFYINKQNPMVLVTDDKLMHTAARKAGLVDKVQRLADYLQQIHLDLDALRR